MKKNNFYHLSILISLVQISVAIFAVNSYERNYGKANFIEWVLIWIIAYLLVEFIWRFTKVIFKIVRKNNNNSHN